MLSELKATKSKVVGTNQVMKALNAGTAKRVFLARDADPKITKPIYELCQKNGVPVFEVDSMEELGFACGIRVGAASAALID